VKREREVNENREYFEEDKKESLAKKCEM